MAFLIDQLNNSGLFAQSAYSACIATKDSDGNDITATYLTGVDLTPYQTTADMVNYQTTAGMTGYATTGDVANKLDTTAFNIPASSNWNSTYDTVQSNSGSWGGGGTIESYNLSAGNYINITKDDVNSAIGIETTGLNVTNWNSNYDTVTANSGAWGGQTLPISAGPGIKLNVVNGTLVASTDETVLWETTAVNGASSCNLSESLKNFKTLGVLATRGYNGAAQPINNGGGGLWCYFDTDIIFSGGLDYKAIAPYMFEGYNWKSSVYSADATYTNLTWFRGISKNMSMDGAGTIANTFTGAVGIKKVVGINRINNA